MYIPHPFAYSSRYAQAVRDHTFIVGLAQVVGPGQGGVDMCHTLVCVQVGLPGLAVVDHTFIFLLALQLLQGAHDALHMTRSSSSVLATSRAACFACILVNAVIVNLLCSRPPSFYAFVHSTLFQARWCAIIMPPTVSWFDHLSSCFISCHCVAYPLCFVPLVWARPNEGVFVRFIAFAVTCSNSEPHPGTNFANDLCA